MRGRIADWNDERGFGFIEPEARGKRVFVHIADYSGRTRPRVGDKVRFSTVHSPKGIKAVRVRPAGRAGLVSPESFRRALLAILALGAFPAVWSQVTRDALPGSVLVVYLAMSFWLFAVYGLDKRAARRGGPRTPEVTLQTMALACGWPGALLAQQVFRHKSAKRSFQMVFWLMVAFNCAGLWLFFSQQGIAIVRAGLALVLGSR